MRKFLSYQIKLSVVLVLMLTNNPEAPAQNPKTKSTDSRNHNRLPNELNKRIADKVNALEPETSTEKLRKSFKQYFSVSSLPIWIKRGNEVFAYFSTGDSKQMACFSIKGKLIYTIRNFEKGQFPTYLCSRVLPAYSNYSINNIKEIRTSESCFHEILMESSSDFVLLQLIEDELLRVKTINKVQTNKSFAETHDKHISTKLGKD